MPCRKGLSWDPPFEPPRRFSGCEVFLFNSLMAFARRARLMSFKGASLAWISNSRQPRSILLHDAELEGVADQHGRGRGLFGGRCVVAPSSRPIPGGVMHRAHSAQVMPTQCSSMADTKDGKGPHDQTQ
jgi:hypothetical protein